MCVCSATTFRPRRLGGLEEGEGVGVDLQDLIEMHRLELLVLVLVLRGQGGGVVCGGDAGGGVEVLWEGAAREVEGRAQHAKRRGRTLEHTGGRTDRNDNSKVESGRSLCGKGGKRATRAARARKARCRRARGAARELRTRR